MDIRKAHKYYRSSRVDVNGMLWRMLYNDNELKKFLHLSPYCATFSILVMALLVFIYSITSANVVDSDEKRFRGLQSETNEKMPRKESVLNIRPAYNCIHKHLRQIDVFQEKARRLLCKERLELSIVNSRMSCLMTLLQPERKTAVEEEELEKRFGRSIEGTVAWRVPFQGCCHAELEAERRSGISCEGKDHHRDDNTSGSPQLARLFLHSFCGNRPLFLSLRGIPP